jgi:hypothetical protein
MAIRKNKKRIDPRYFMDEKTDIIKEEFSQDANSAKAEMRAAKPQTTETLEEMGQDDPSERLLDLAGEVSVLASRADEQIKNALLNLQGELEAIASRLRH